MSYRPVWVIFDGRPGPLGPRFVEVEDDHGSSVRAGTWERHPVAMLEGQGWSRLGPFLPVVGLADRLAEVLTNFGADPGLAEGIVNALTPRAICVSRLGGWAPETSDPTAGVSCGMMDFPIEGDRDEPEEDPSPGA